MTILLTSFTTWLPHQKSNAADDLLEIVSQKCDRDGKNNFYYLRKLPVETTAASKLAISKVRELNPLAIVCCGMAESRYKLTIESNARCNEDCLQTQVNLPKLVSQLTDTYISHDAGQFVCEGLYYQVLNYLYSNKYLVPCIFVHVPVLTTNNTKVILQDFSVILQQLHSHAVLRKYSNN